MPFSLQERRFPCRLRSAKFRELFDAAAVSSMFESNAQLAALLEGGQLGRMLNYMGYGGYTAVYGASAAAAAPAAAAQAPASTLQKVSWDKELARGCGGPAAGAALAAVELPSGSAIVLPSSQESLSSGQEILSDVLSGMEALLLAGSEGAQEASQQLASAAAAARSPSASAPAPRLGEGPARAPAGSTIDGLVSDFPARSGVTSLGPRAGEAAGGFMHEPTPGSRAELRGGRRTDRADRTDRPDPYAPLAPPVLRQRGGSAAPSLVGRPPAGGAGALPASPGLSAARGPGYAGHARHAGHAEHAGHQVLQNSPWAGGGPRLRQDSDAHSLADSEASYDIPSARRSHSRATGDAYGTGTEAYEARKSQNPLPEAKKPAAQPNPGQNPRRGHPSLRPRPLRRAQRSAPPRLLPGAGRQRQHERLRRACGLVSNRPARADRRRRRTDISDLAGRTAAGRAAAQPRRQGHFAPSEQLQHRV